MKKFIIIILILPFLFSCNWIFNEIISGLKPQKETKNYTSIKPQEMFVTATSGLYMRSDSTLESNIIGLLPFREKVTIYAKSNKAETINDITGFWYSINEKNDLWVFGGYLSKDLPSFDYQSLIIGMWDIVGKYNSVGNQNIMIFYSDHGFISGVRNSGHGIFGSWRINDNVISAAGNFPNYNESLNYDREAIRYRMTIIEVINRDRIRIRYDNGEIDELVRSTD